MRRGGGRHAEDADADAADFLDDERRAEGLATVAHIGGDEGEAREAHLHEEGVDGVVEFVVAEGRGVVAHVVVRQDVRTRLEVIGHDLPRVEVAGIEQQDFAGEGIAEAADESRTPRHPAEGIVGENAAVAVVGVQEEEGGFLRRASRHAQQKKQGIE